MVKSIYNQFDCIRIYMNNYNGEEHGLKDPEGKIYFTHGRDLADNAKFFFLPQPGDEPELYFTLDDDIKFPANYRSKTESNLDKYRGAVITYHGRKLYGKGLQYYKSHKCYRFSARVPYDEEIDVAGTGVTAWDTRYFNPSGLCYAQDVKMADMIFSYEAALNKVPIVVCEHGAEWFKYLFPEKGTTIYEEMHNTNTVRQNWYADKIFDIKN